MYFKQIDDGNEKDHFQEVMTTVTQQCQQKLEIELKTCSKQESEQANLNQIQEQGHDVQQPEIFNLQAENEKVEILKQNKESQPEKNDDSQEEQWKQNNFSINTSLIGKILLIDVFRLLIKAAKDSSIYQKLSLENVPHLLPEERMESIHKILDQYLDEAIVKAGRKGKVISGMDFVWIFILVINFYCVSTFSASMLSSIQIKYLLQSIEQYGVTSEAYLYALILTLCMLYYSLFYHHIPKMKQLIFSQFKIAFMKAVYQKVSSLSSFAVKNANVGKLINIVSNDLTNIESQFPTIMDVILTPYPLIVITYIIYNTYGNMGLFAIFVISLSYPLQGLISHIGTRYYEQKSKIIDERVNQTNEIIEGIRIIKMYAWEDAFKNKIKLLRLQEFKKNIISQIFYLANHSIELSSGVFGTVLLFSLVYYFDDGKNLDVGTIFSTLELLQFLKITVFCTIGQGILGIFQLKVVLKRMISIFTLQNSSMTCIEGSNNLESQDIKNGNIEFSNFTAYWQQNTPVLKDINLNIKQGECISIVGKVGSGKSSLLSCILKEIPFYKGNFNFNGKIAYVEQEPYIFNCSIKENITFGKDFDQDLYDKVIKSCCLKVDFKQFDQGDETQIGERGLNISGGQKARISLARALYSEADIYLFDDPLSAVDANVAKKIFFNAIQGLCKGSTVILTTHQIHFTRHTDRIIILNDGQIQIQDTYSNIEKDLIKLQKSISQAETKDNNQAEEEDQQSIENEKNSILFDETSQKSLQMNQDQNEKQVKVNKGDELSQNTQVTFETYKFFYKLSSLPWSWFVIISLFALSEVLYIIYTRILGKIQSEDQSTLFQNLWWIVLAYFVNQITKNIFIVIYFNNNTFNLFEKMINSLLRGTISFFDLTPSGNILNLFSTDIGLIDGNLGMVIAESIEIIISVIFLLGSIALIAPSFIIIFIIEFLILIYFIKKTKHALYHSKQLDLNLRAPVFTFFNVAVSGILPIRVYKKQSYFENKFNELGNNSLRATWFFFLTSRGFGSQVQLYAAISSAIGIFLIISSLSSGPLIGQAIVFFMTSTESLQWGIRQLIQADIIMSSSQRCKYFVEQKTEAQLKTAYDEQNIECKKPTENNQQSIENTADIQNYNFPSKGEVVFKNVKMRYHQSLTHVLKDLSFKISPGKRVGIVGRTGAGKSSIIQTLFRMTEIEQESEINQNKPLNVIDIEANILKSSGIFIDGHNIKDLGLHTIRQGISIIPQLPFVFTGTIRYNLDPFTQYNDKQIEEVLADIQLIDKVNSLEKKMYTEMSNTSQIFSSGQKQLICLGRAILRQSKLTVLDEATANCDMLTDELIQKKIRQRFENSTIVTIAHRLNTIADYDHIIVIDQGQAVEQGAPYELLQNQNGHFYQMVEKTGKKNFNAIFKIAEEYQNRKL